MKILHVTASMSSEWGGPTKVVTEITEKLVEKGVKISIFSPFKRGGGLNVINPKGIELQLFPQNFIDRLWTSYSWDFARAIKQNVHKFDIIHIHEIWNYPNYVASWAAKRAGKPYIVTIHGALDPWCLNHKAFKKKIYALLIQKRILREASVIHAITNEEIKQIKNFVNNNNNIIMIPNGINPEDFINLPSRKELEKLYPELIGKKVLLFLGRIHPIKGLDLLAKAFVIIARERDDVCLLIAGPDSDGYKDKIMQTLKKGHVLNKAIFAGMLKGQKKLIALGGADIFILPSYSEGFSMAILEAMISNLPVIITHQCNFPEIAEYEAGIVIEPDLKQLAEALNILLNNSKLCKKMGENGKRLVLENFTWDKIADKMIKIYEDILETGYMSFVVEGWAPQDTRTASAILLDYEYYLSSTNAIGIKTYSPSFSISDWYYSRQISNIDDGQHKLNVKCYDAYNNENTQSVMFTISSQVTTTSTTTSTSSSTSSSTSPTSSSTTTPTSISTSTSSSSSTTTTTNTTTSSITTTTVSGGGGGGGGTRKTTTTTTSSTTTTTIRLVTTTVPTISSTTTIPKEETTTTAPVSPITGLATLITSPIGMAVNLMLLVSIAGIIYIKYGLKKK